MANSASNKGPPSKNVIYDSRNDTNAGGKRAVDITGEVSVAERARLFGAQINRSSAPKLIKPISVPLPSASSSVEEQPERTFNSQADRNYQRYRSGPSQGYAYSSSHRPPNNYRSAPPQNYDRPTGGGQYSFNDSHQYSTVTRPHQQQQQQQQPMPIYESAQYSSSNKPQYPKTSNPPVSSGESYITEDESYYKSQPRQHASPIRNPNYFRPIQDPLEVLYKQSSHEYSLPSMPTNANSKRNDFQTFDLGNLIGRIQQDYLNNARPYVSSIQFIENEQNLANIGLVTSGSNRQDYSNNRTSNDLYLRPGASYQYDVIDTSQFSPTYSRPVQDQHYQHGHHHHHGSTRRRRHHGHYRDRASSPIVAEKPKTPTPPPNPPEEKPSTPVETEEEEDDETANTKTEENKTTEAETSAEEEEEEESTAAPVPPPAAAPNPTQRLGVALPGLVSSTPTIAARTPAKEQSETESSESEESESESDSNSDSDDNKKRKKSKPAARTVQEKPQPITRGTPQLTTRGTPQSITRGTPQSTPLTTKTVTNKTNDPPESLNSVKSFDVEDSKKSSGFAGKFKSMAKVFRRKKS